MIETQAWVVASDGDHAEVEAVRRSGCDHCGVRGGCGTSVLSKVLGRRVTRMRALNPTGAAIGQEVTVGVDEGAYLRGAMTVYMVPLVAALACALGLRLLVGATVPGEALAAALGLALGIAWSRRHADRVRIDERYQAVILRSVPCESVEVRFSGADMGPLIDSGVDSGALATPDSSSAHGDNRGVSRR
ncbi:MAG: SoxR reducing system RseC family protein [Gammaproteobacteria bacterium]